MGEQFPPPPPPSRPDGLDPLEVELLALGRTLVIDPPRVDLADADAVTAAVRAHVPEATVVQTAGHDWVADPFSKGTWLAIPPGWFSDGTFDALAEPEGRLAFAGSDIAAEGAGCRVCGAMIVDEHCRFCLQRPTESRSRQGFPFDSGSTELMEVAR